MKFYRNLFVLVALLAALIATYIYIPKQSDEKTVGDTIELRTIDESRMTEVETNNQHGRIVLVRDGEQWKMSEPEDCQVDELSTGSFIDLISGMEVDSIVEESPEDFGKYGLRYPQSQITVKTSDGKSTVFMLGDETPMGGEYYIKTSDSSTVYKINSTKAEELLKPAAEFKAADTVVGDSDESAGE